MIATAQSGRTGTYNNGQPYRPARGRFALREAVEDQLPASHAVIELPREQPSAKRFLQVTVRELKIRCYQPKTIKAYRNRIRNLLRWFGGPPHLITREDVRCYLEVLVDGGAGSSWLSTTLSAIRTLFDKFCGQSITLGLVTPRRAKKLPVVLGGLRRCRHFGENIKKTLIPAASLGQNETSCFDRSAEKRLGFSGQPLFATR